KERQRRLHGEQHAADVGVERLVEMLLGDLAKRPDFVEPGVDDEHVDAAGFFPDRLVDAVDVGEVGGVAPDGANGAADFGNCFVEPRLIPAGDEDPSALADKVGRDAATDASTAAGDDGDLTCELAHRRFPPSVSEGWWTVRNRMTALAGDLQSFVQTETVK